MTLLSQLAFQHSAGFVVAALSICMVAGGLLAALMEQVTRSKPAMRRWWLAGTALAAGLGVWTTHFLAMLGYRPDLTLGFDPGTTVLSAVVSVLAVGLPLAASMRARSTGGRAILGASGGLGIGVMHYCGMAAIEGCLQTHSHAMSFAAFAAGTLLLGLARGVPALSRSGPATGVLFTLAVGGTHFTAIAGTLLTRTSETFARHDNFAISVMAIAGAMALFLAAFAAILTVRRFERQEQAHTVILSRALENMSNGLVFIDAQEKLGLFNTRFVELFHVAPGALRTGMSLDAYLDAVSAGAGWNARTRQDIGAGLRERFQAPETRKSELVMEDGRILEIESRPVQSGGIVLTFDDVTGERHAKTRIEELAFQDPLTGLANRRALQMRMEEGFHPRQRFKLLLIDLDRFKTVNDTYGHGMGDQLLVQVASRIRLIAGAEGFVARLGGDEMAVLVHGDLDEALGVANTIVEAVAEPFLLGGAVLSIGCSIGLCCTDDASDAAELMQRSDIALYAAKRSGRGRATCYRSGMMEEAAGRHRLETDMRSALERGEFHLAYQPILSLDGDEIIGCEALIRWDHPELGAVSPVQFIPLAEETGQILQIGRWVLEEACREAARQPTWQHVAVNASPVQLHSPLFLSHVTRALADSGLAPERLEIELTETAIVEDGRRVAAALSDLRTLGIKIAMDDFGTGYSSLAHLRDLPFDRIKIDRSFVSTAETDRHSMAVLRALVQIGRDLDIRILAEGVETQSQLTLVRALGCNCVQGYLVGRPERLDGIVSAPPHTERLIA